jgi:hypothetical protein
MPLANYSVSLLVKRLLELGRGLRGRGRVLSLSIPDLTIGDDELDVICGWPVARTIPIHPESDGILRWHKLQGRLPHIRDTQAFLSELGFDLESLDLSEGRGGETPFDLSTPMPPKLRGRYDFVFDCISFQVFNVVEAMRTMIDAVRVGGSVLTTSPVTMVNTGYWCPSPVAIDDFLRANGFRLDTAKVFQGTYGGPEIPVARDRRARLVPDDAWNVVLATKTEHVAITYPVMAKFRSFPRCLK